MTIRCTILATVILLVIKLHILFTDAFEDPTFDGRRELLRTGDRRENDLYAPRDRYPYVASLQHPASGQHFCMGTLIHKNWILTYARCVDTRRFTTAVGNPVVALGSESITGPFKERHSIIAAVVHPLYTGASTGPYDVALLKLKTPSEIQPLVTLHCGTPPLLEDLETRALSWSRQESNGPYSKQLLEITGLHIMDSEDCVKRYGYSPKVPCLKATKGVVCNGGTGGPIIVPSFPDRLIGIAIENKECIGDAKTAGYISINLTREWIWNQTAEFIS